MIELYTFCFKPHRSLFIAKRHAPFILCKYGTLKIFLFVSRKSVDNLLRALASCFSYFRIELCALEKSAAKTTLE